MGALVALVAAVLGLAAPRPAAPTVVGPRDTTLERPVYKFSGRGATGFRCAFDSTILHRCARRYSERLEPGAHLLRVRSVGRKGALSRVVAVRIRVRLPVPELIVDETVSVGVGAGVPAPHADGVWVPVTSAGTLVRVTGGTVASRLTVGGTTSSEGALDSAVTDGRRSTDRDVWSAADAGARIARVDPRTNAVTGNAAVASRPGGLAASERAVWAFHFLQGTVTRLDVETAVASRFEVPGARATGIAYGNGALWLLSTQPSRVQRLDPDTGAVTMSVDIRPTFAPRRSLVDTWWLAAGDRAVWATLPNHGGVVRIDAGTGEARYIRIPYGDPFGIAVGAGSAWVATDRAVLQLDATTGTLQAAALVPRAQRTAFVSISYGFGAAWLTNYDRGTLSRVRAPGTPS